MIWLVQNVTFNAYNYEILRNSLEKCGQRFIRLDFALYEYSLDLKIKGCDPTQIIPIGTKEFIRFSMLQPGWRVFYGPNWEYDKVAAGYGDYFLNSDVVVARLDDIELPNTGKMYIRQNAGFNMAKGQLISCYAWEDWRNGFKRPRTDITIKYDNDKITGDTLFVYASPKVILAEYRVFVIKGRVVSSSQYMIADINFIVKLENTDDNEDVMSFAQKAVDHWSPGETFVLDLARTPDGLKVLEVNCINCSGWYDINTSKVVKAIQDNYETRKSQ